RRRAEPPWPGGPARAARAPVRGDARAVGATLHRPADRRAQRDDRDPAAGARTRARDARAGRRGPRGRSPAMTEPRTPPAAAPAAKNRIGLARADYDGSKTTLCPGCGHNAITGGIIQAAPEAGLDPARVAKLSGIGCSSKTPAYFLGHSHGFNAVHGRMPSIATGVRAANRELLLIGVSGDGDTASIGLGQFCHLVRRNVPVVYLIENNGVYGLTKGQFS